MNGNGVAMRESRKSEQPPVTIKSNADIVSLLAGLESFDIRKLDASETDLMASFCATWMLDYLKSLDPIWDRMITAALAETRLRPIQLLGSWIVRTLEEARHINVPVHPYFVAAPPTLHETQCEFCHEMFQPAHPGQKFCSNRCGIASKKSA